MTTIEHPEEAPMRWLQQVLIVVVALGGVERALAQTPVPELKFVEPTGFVRTSILPPPHDFASFAGNATLQVYPFRVFNGDVRQAFSRTLLREQVHPRYYETSVAPGARLDSFMMRGADIVLRAHFRYGVGHMHQRLRMVVVVGTAVAIVDVSASSNSAWEHVRPQIDAFAATLQVVSGTANPAVVAPPPTSAGKPAVVAPPPTSAGKPTTAAGKTVAGLYMGFIFKFDAIQGQVRGVFYYLLSADGQVYRAIDNLSVPGNDPAQFDFVGARRADPSNSGHYIVQGDEITILIGRAPERLVTRLERGNMLRIRGIAYERQ